MRYSPSNIAITGYAGVGKTTLIREVASQLATYQPIGFYTAEIRECGVRLGFELNGLDGSRAVLAHVDHRSPAPVGRYGVDLPTFESFLGRLQLDQTDRRLVIIDEIGRMECLSPRFIQLMVQLLDSDRVIVSTVAMRGGGLIRKVKRRNDTLLYEVTIVSRRRLREEIPAAVRAALGD